MASLERLFRPRLLYRLEEQLNSRLSEPAFVYEALKVYLMLGGQHPPDRGLINPGCSATGPTISILVPPTQKAAGAGGSSRRDARSGTEQPPLVELDGRLIEEAQKLACSSQRGATGL